LIRGANLRELFGDTDGALDLLNMALQSTPPAEVEDAAWITTQMAHLDLSVGRITEAEKLLANALAMFPDYTYALGNLAKVRIEQKRFDDAVTLLQRRYNNAPRAENLYDLAEALQLAGRKSEAEKAFAVFEQRALQESSKADNSNRELIFCYSDQAKHPEKALEIARAEYARRHDVFTLDAYAWALHKNGQDGEARKHIETALAIGIRDARMLAHAGEIALKLGDRAAAERYLEEASELHAPGSDRARTILATIGTTGMK
jgi:tetratricopeptide (TPR) repeat protein